MWNVKDIDFDINGMLTSINRNIVECKVNNGMLTGFNGISINRNIVECKDCCRRSSLVRTVVLIETLWNVKVDAKPLWYLGESRINRNIVECKDAFLEDFDRSVSSY